MRVLLTLIFISIVAARAMAAEPKRVLLVVGNGVPRTDIGFDMGELAQAYAIFALNGFDTDIASPAGGAAHAKQHESSGPIASFLADSQARRKLAQTLPVMDIDSARYDAVFVIGGSAAMFDFPDHEGLQRLLAAMHERGAVIGAVCHGPAALVNVKLANDRFLIEAKRVTGFTAEEEKHFGGDVADAYPFVLEQKLRERNATMEKAPIMMAHVSRDGLVVTGQNPFSTARAAEEVVRALGRAPAQRQPYRDEATVLLIADLLGDDEVAVAARVRAVKTPSAYDPSLLAAYGSLLSRSADDASTIRRGLVLLEIASRSFTHPKVVSASARAHVRLGERDQARAILKNGAAEFPQSTAITKMLEELDLRNDDPAQASTAADRRPR